jgi:type II secretory pathway component PulK
MRAETKGVAVVVGMIVIFVIATAIAFVVKCDVQSGFPRREGRSKKRPR